MRLKRRDIYEFTDKFEQWFTKKRKLAFVSALFIGFVTHYWFLSNLFMSPDGIVCSIVYSASDFETSIGRWGIDLIDSIRANKSVSSVSSMFSLFFAAFGCVLLTDVLEFRKKISVVLTSTAIMVSPALTLTLLYEYCSDAYLCAFFLSVLSVYCIQRIKNTPIAIVLSGLCLCGSLSIYQNYIGVMAGTCIIIIIKNLLHEPLSITAIIRDGQKKLAAILTGCVLYYASTRILCIVKGITPNKYNGVNELSPLTILASLGHSSIGALKKIKHFFLHDTYVFNLSWHRDRMFIIFFILLILCITGLVIEKKLYKNKIRLFLLAICLLLLPLGINAVFLIVPDSDLYALTSMQLMLVFPFLFLLTEEFEMNKYIFIKWSSLIVSTVILFTYYMAANYSYSYLELSYHQARATADRIVSRMQTTDGYTKETPCIIAGILTDEYFPRDKAYRGYTICNIVEGPIFHGDYSGSVECWRKFCLIYQGENLNFCDPLRYEEIVKSDEFKQMDIFPSENSVKIINDVIVTKLTDKPPMP